MRSFLNNLDQDLQQALLVELRNFWNHTSTAIEGNTLTLGKTAFVLEEGLTVSGKPLKDHEEVWTKNRWFLSTPHRMMSLF